MTRRLTPDEQRIINAMAERGGSLCPGDGYIPGFETKRILRRLERQGLIRIEPTDDGFRYSLVSP